MNKKILINPSRNKRAIIKTIFYFTLFIVSASAKAQETAASNAMIHMTVETIASDDISNLNQDENQSFMRMFDREIKSVIWIKEGQSKTEADMGFGKSVMYYNTKTKTTTTLFEMMGRKMGFYSNDDELKSFMSANDSLMNQKWLAGSEDVQIEYLNETKVIAQKTCKKAIIHYQNKKQEELEQIVWYYPDYKLSKKISLSAVFRSSFTPGIHKLKGFPMEMDIKRNNGTITKFIVTKMETGMPIDEAIFNIPAGYDIKPMSEMMKGGMGGFQYRIENN
jgi:hypothetical protein